MWHLISSSVFLSQVQFPGCVCGVRDHHAGGERGRHPHRHFRPKITLLQLQGPGGELQQVHYFLHHSRLADSKFSCMLLSDLKLGSSVLAGNLSAEVGVYLRCLWQSL